MFFFGMNTKPQMFKRERILSPSDTEDNILPTPQRNQPLEISVNVRDVYFSLNDKEFTEIGKTVLLTVDFCLGGEYGLTDVRAALRIGEFSIPYDNLQTFSERITEMRIVRPESPVARPRSGSSVRPNLSFLDIFEESQVFLSSMLTGRFMSLFYKYRKQSPVFVQRESQVSSPSPSKTLASI
jgi:hypothetical protein